MNALNNKLKPCIHELENKVEMLRKTNQLLGKEKLSMIDSVRKIVDNNNDRIDEKFNINQFDHSLHSNDIYKKKGCTITGCSGMVHKHGIRKKHRM